MFIAISGYSSIRNMSKFCVNQIAALGIQGNGGEGGGGSHITEESIKSTLDSLENKLQRVKLHL